MVMEPNVDGPLTHPSRLRSSWLSSRGPGHAQGTGQLGTTHTHSPKQQGTDILEVGESLVIHELELRQRHGS